MKILTIALTSLLLFLSSSSIAAEDNYRAPNIYISNISPWMEGETGSCTRGIICDYFNQLLSNTSIDENYIYTSLSRANEKFYEGGQFVALFPYDKNFTSKYHLIGEVLTYDVGLLFLDHSHEFNPKNDEICITRNNPHKVDGYNYIEVNAYEQCFEMLSRQRVKYILLTNLEFTHHYSNPDLQEPFGFQKLYSIPLWLYLSTAHTKDSKMYKEVIKSYEILKMSN